MSDLPLSRRGVLGAAVAGAAGIVAGCAGRGSSTGQPAAAPGSASATPSAGAGTAGSPAPTPSPTASPTATASPAQIAARATVPVLCYHQVRRYESGDSGYTRQLLVAEPAKFEAQLDAITAAGYTTIDPDEYHAHLTTGAPLPAKPVILSFDDGKDNQSGFALPAVLERDMKATWFVMTVVIGNHGWTTKKQIRQLADAGITIGCHTWDHHDVRKLAGTDYAVQFTDARKTLQDISGQPVDHFAYPYGAWNAAALPHLRKAGFSSAYQLDEKPLDRREPLLTLRRALAVSTWTGEEVVAALAQMSRPAKA